MYTLHAFLSDLPPITTCLRDVFSECPDWTVIGDIITKGFMQFAELDTCALKVAIEFAQTRCRSKTERLLMFVLQVVSEKNVSLVEGGYSEVVAFESFVPPSVYCLDFSSIGISTSIKLKKIHVLV